MTRASRDHGAGSAPRTHAGAASRTAQLAVVLVAILAAGCHGGPRPGAGPAWQAQVDTIGDTIVVRTVAGSAWGTADLALDVRIGAVEGADYEIFGEIAALAVDTAGDIYVYDGQVPALRKYAPDGRYLRTLGRKGGGPGEYAKSDGGLAVLRDGRVVLRDPGNARFTVYAPDGTYLTSWPMRGGTYTSVPVIAAGDGGFYTPVFSRDEPMRLVHYAPDGTPGDSLAPPNRRVESATVTARVTGASQTWTVPFTATAPWVFHPDGYFVSAVTDEYAIDLLRPNDRVLRLTKPAQPVPATADERAAEERRVTDAMRQLDPSWRWNGPPIPKTKPIIAGLYAGGDGRIWVALHQPGVRVPDEELEPGTAGARPAPQFREPVVFDVFEKDGRYLGRVRAPTRFSTWPDPVFRGDLVWSTESDAAGVQYVVRYRIVPERESRGR
jgi:hypothetical protein